MHIKSITISGFKSYKDTVKVDLSPKHNTVIGSNGFGKTNFFRAIQFVLGEKEFTNLSHADREEMLYQGAGVMTAYVEIVFDNSDGRLPIDAEEVAFRRTIGMKKDEYFVNQKRTLKTDVTNLLEAAGFSRSNPYYVVQQGKISALSQMKASQRLELIKEVAGTTVYDEKRKESTKIMQETQKTVEQINENIQHIEKRLSELNEEKEVLQEFRLLDRKRKALEYTLHETDIANAGRELERLESTLAQERGNMNSAAEKLSQLLEEIANSEAEIEKSSRQVGESKRELDVLEQKRKVLAEQKVTDSIKLKDFEEDFVTKTKKSEEKKVELEKVKKLIKEKQAELEKDLNVKFNAQKQVYNDVKEKLEASKRRQVDLEKKKNHKVLFRTKKERDDHFVAEKTKLSKILESKKKTLKESEASREKQEEEIAKLQKSIQERTKALEDLDRAQNQATDNMQSLKKKLQTFQETREEEWRNKQQVGEKKKVAEDELKRATDTLKHTMPSSYAAGLDALDEIARDLKVEDKVYGPLFRLIRARRPIYNAAIESAAQNQLLHVVVENDVVAAKLINELQRRKAGRVTFKPLNQMRPKDMSPELSDFLASQLRGVSNDPSQSQTSESQASEDSNGDAVSKILQDRDPDAIALITKVQYDEKFEPAVRVALDNILLCRNQKIAGEYSRRFGVNCVTLEGDEVNRRGAMTGGFHDSKKSRLNAAALWKKAKVQVDTLTEEHILVSANADKVDQSITVASGEVEKAKSLRTRLLQESADRLKEKKSSELQLEKTKENDVAVAIEEQKKAMQIIEGQIKGIEREMDLPMSANLSASEIQELDEISKELEGLTEEETNAQMKLDDISRRIEVVKAELKNDLILRKQNLEAELERLFKITSSGYASQEEEEAFEDSIENLRQALGNHDMNLERVREKQEELDGIISSANSRLRSAKESLDELKSKQRSLAKEVESAEESWEKISLNRTAAIEKREKAMQKIRELGSLPALELEKFKNLSRKQLESQIKQVNEELKKYGHVNKKALDQFTNFSDQREMLLTRHAETVQASESIQQLIKHLDREKDEAILRTFKGVAKNFREVFHELVPHGRGQLNMVNRTDADPNASQVEKISGIVPAVSFSSTGEVFKTQQLSGGQTALVALALVFAIQRCDPAPFYLFDEIDQALDSNHRAAVASLIQRQANAKDNNAQFVTTTFRSELVEVADQCFGVQYQNKVSNVIELEKSDAMEFIQQIIATDSMIPASSSLTSSKKTKSKPAKSTFTQEMEDDENQLPNDSESAAAEAIPKKSTPRKRNRIEAQ